MPTNWMFCLFYFLRDHIFNYYLKGKYIIVQLSSEKYTLHDHTTSLKCRFWSPPWENYPAKQTIQHKESQHNPHVNPSRVIFQSSTLQHIIPSKQTLRLIINTFIPRETLIFQAPILVSEQRIKWVSIKRNVVHKNPISGDTFLGDEVTGEEKESSKNRTYERVPGYEIRRDGAEKEDERARHQDDEPNDKGEESEGSKRRVEANNPVNRNGEENRHGEKERQENDSVGNHVRRYSVGSSRGFLHQNLSFLEEYWECFDRRREKKA